MFASINPATGETVARFDEHSADDVEAALQAAAEAQRAWARRPLGERAGSLPRIAQVLQERKAEFARLITLEMGKPLAEALAEIEKCAWTLDFYAEAAPRYLADTPVASNAAESKVVFDPLGAVRVSRLRSD